MHLRTEFFISWNDACATFALIILAIHHGRVPKELDRLKKPSQHGRANCHKKRTTLVRVRIGDGATAGLLDISLATGSGYDHSHGRSITTDVISDRRGEARKPFEVSNAKMCKLFFS